VAGKIDKEKTQPGWPIKAVVAAALVMFTAAISLAIWKSGFFSSQPAQQTVSPSPQFPSPPPTQVAPLPQVSPLPQTAPPTRAAPFSKGVSPTPVPPPTEAAPPTRVAPPTQVNGTSSLFKKFDANNDGKVTLNEFMMWREVQFNNFDADKDGSLSRLEVSAGKSKFARLLGQNFDLIDTNQDQKLSRDEYREASRRRFLMMDANRDGNLTQKELAAAKDSQ